MVHPAAAYIDEEYRTVASSIHLLPCSLTNWQIGPRRRHRHHNLQNADPDSHPNRVVKANAIDLKRWAKEKVRASSGAHESDLFGLCKSLTE